MNSFISDKQKSQTQRKLKHSQSLLTVF